MRVTPVILAATAILGLSAVSLAQHRVERPEGEEPMVYLTKGAFDILAVLPPAPRRDDPRWKADRAIFRQTRAFVGMPRWRLATNDVKLGTDDMMRDFSCAVGVELTPKNAPLTAHLVEKAGSDTARNSGIAKSFYKRQRPYLIDRGPVCQPVGELQGSYDYPSGHTTAGWTWATLLAQLAPDRATAILARGRAFGESRIVCGAHNASAVDAGRLSASATLTALSSSPAFQADLAAARTELSALRQSSAAMHPPIAGCAAERALIAQPIFDGPAPQK